MEIQVELDGGKRVSTRIGNHRIATDQPVRDGGEDSAPAPFDLFLASLATCAGFFVQSYCQSKQIDTTGITLTLTTQREPGSKTPSRIVTTIGIPRHLPDHLHKTLCRVARQCSVARTIEAGPELAVEARTLDG
jgi:ribosomal protein S12 methylthiotransferase accessory factor